MKQLTAAQKRDIAHPSFEATGVSQMSKLTVEQQSRLKKAACAIASIENGWLSDKEQEAAIDLIANEIGQLIVATPFPCFVHLGELDSVITFITMAMVIQATASKQMARNPD